MCNGNIVKFPQFSEDAHPSRKRMTGSPFHQSTQKAQFSPAEHQQLQYTPQVAACHEVLVMFFVHYSMTLTLARGLCPMTFALYRPANKKTPATDGPE